MLLKFLRGTILPGVPKGFVEAGEVVEVDGADARNLMSEGAAEIAPNAPPYMNPAHEQRVIAEHSTAAALRRSLGERAPLQEHPTEATPELSAVSTDGPADQPHDPKADEPQQIKPIEDQDHGTVVKHDFSEDTHTDHAS